MGNRQAKERAPKSNGEVDEPENAALVDKVEVGTTPDGEKNMTVTAPCGQHFL